MKNCSCIFFRICHYIGVFAAGMIAAAILTYGVTACIVWAGILAIVLAVLSEVLLRIWKKEEK